MARVPSAAARAIGERIRSRRASLQWTQDDLSEHSGIDAANIRSYENGNALMSLFSLVRIAEALDAKPGDLLDGVTVDMFPSTRVQAELPADAPRRGAARG
ncbi:helix-turn-helix domain-containing protein [Pseudoclavibacter soli]|uniref:helix-turn-helix domain-containing protein n=1 Tax=Pseudoclavibacter soli TaxID=452623 RepID=UPI00056A993D|nr:helix-turn-helix transcriptional regulator [Pseudoclavibacter soli]